MGKWNNAEVIFAEADGFTVCWGKFNDTDTKKCLGVGYPNFPNLRSGGIAYIVIPEFLAQSIFDRILSFAVVNDYETTKISEILSALKEWDEQVKIA
jgi:hypothetical protein